MSQWTHVKGKFTIRFATDYCFDKDDEVNSSFMKEPLDIYKVMMKAPRITGSESDCIFSVDITDQAPYYSNEDDFIYYEAKIKIKGRLRDGEFEKKLIRKSEISLSTLKRRLVMRLNL